MHPRAAPGGDRGRGRGRALGLALGRGRGRGSSEYGGGSERGGGSGGSEYGYGRGLSDRGAGPGRGRGYRGGAQGGSDRGWPLRGRGIRDRGRGVAVDAGSSITNAFADEVAGDVGEAGHHPLVTLSSGRTGQLPAGHIEAIGDKRRKYGDNGRVIRLRSNHVEFRLDQKMLYQYDGMYLSYSWDKKLKNAFDTITIQLVSTGSYSTSWSTARRLMVVFYSYFSKWSS